MTQSTPPTVRRNQRQNEIYSPYEMLPFELLLGSQPFD
jgi:hypothetical protein